MRPARHFGRPSGHGVFRFPAFYCTPVYCVLPGLPYNTTYTILTHVYDDPDFGLTPSPPCSSTEL